MKIDTICVQEGYSPKNGEPRVLPIYQSTTFKYDSSAEMGDLFDLKKDGFFYSRLANPTADAPEKKLAALEGGIGCMLTSSGQAAALISVLNVAGAGDHIISSASIYGGVFNLFYKTLAQMGIETTFVPCDLKAEDLEKYFKPNTKLVYGETLSNPSLDILDIEEFAKAAHAHNVPLIVDNTFPTPINCRPFEFDTDIVIHSTTKYLDGHAVAVGGAIVDSGNFDWTKGNFPMLTEPDDSYHGIAYTSVFGKNAFIVKARAHLMRDLGSSPAPMNAFLLNLGMETLALRMRKHCENAKKVADYLVSRMSGKNAAVTWVNYPDLPSNHNYELCRKYLPNGSSGVISFGIKGGREAATKFMDSVQLAAVVTHVADARTSLLHPASTTHRQLSDEQLKECGVSPDLIRFSVGIEDAEDIIADIDQAIEKAVK
ncbi:MAG: aminotransferase class I/II-fold pyridoxal phosphate-dependent enzyme [Clostridia bacterium]|nr:aminotransferase class I/II-fold pyridoxal phosphate-dependent enzyme [Clostridia bacterium]